MTDPITILYIEDDPGSQVLVQRTLNFLGYHVVLASRGLEGIDAAIREMPKLILMDINLPDMSGREVTTRLRADGRFRTTPIVALTALSQQTEREKTFAAGVTGYLTKPIDIDKLPDQIARFLSGERETVSAEAMADAQTSYNQELVNRLETKVRELERTNSELKRLDKVKDDFIQLTAHELRTPLTLIYGYSRLLEESPVVQQLKSSSPEVNAFVAGLVESIERLHVVINEILVVSRIATGRIELSLGPINLADIGQQIVAEYNNPARQRNLMIIFDRSQWPSLVQADADLMRLALSNVLGNAIKYTPDGGVITITSRITQTNVLLSFQDSGIGISKEDQLRIFDRFYTAGQTRFHSTSKTAFRGGGLGLGLSICRGIIEAHGGRIWVESKGRDEEDMPGSTFYIDLPLNAHVTNPVRGINQSSDEIS